MKTLYDLVLEYKTMVEAHLTSLADYWDEASDPAMDEDTEDSLNAGISSSQATLKEINEVLGRDEQTFNPACRGCKFFVENGKRVDETPT
jgi:hypothetical protein